MSWGRNDQPVSISANVQTSNGAPIGTYTAVKLGGGANANFGNTAGSRANVDLQMFNNATPGAFMSGVAVGVFGVSATEQANNRLNNDERGAHAGWNLRRAGTGPVVSFTIVDAGSDLANGETLTVSNGTSNATAVVTTNATSNIVSLTITSGGGGFTNTDMAVIEFDRQQYLDVITVTGSTSGFSNDDVIVAANGIVDGLATISTNSTGGFTNSDITIVNIGLFSNTAANGSVILTVLAANGDPSSGTGETLVANLTASSTGDISITLGGRAGRVSYETLVAMGSLGAQTAAFGTPASVDDAATDDTYFPGV